MDTFITPTTTTTFIHIIYIVFLKALKDASRITASSERKDQLNPEQLIKRNKQDIELKIRDKRQF